MTIEEINKIPMVFIVGMGRSGTTLLRTILDANSETLFPPEAKVIIHLKQRYNHKKKWTNQLIDNFLDDLYTEVKFAKNWNINITDLRNQILKYDLKDINFPILIKLIYLNFPSNFDKKSIKVLGDKNPSYSLFIPELKEVFPNIKIVHLIRDYRDCILSNKKLFKRKNVFALAVLWRIYNTKIKMDCKELDIEYLAIRYEDIVYKAKDSITSLCEFIHITFDESMLNFNKEIKLEPMTHLVLMKTHPGLAQPINDSSVGKWKKEFSEIEKRRISYVLNDFGVQFGYEKIDHHSSYFWGMMRGYVINYLDTAIIKGYFLLPFSIRKLIRKTANMIFAKTGFYTVYNQGNLLHQLAKDNKLGN